MADETQVTKPEPFEVERNGVKLKFEPVDYKRGAKKEEGKFFLAPTVTTENIEQVRAYAGLDFELSLWQARFNVLAQRWMEEASTNTDETPKPFDMEEFVKYASEMSARGLTSEQIDDEIKRLSQSIVSVLGKATPETMADVQAKALEIAAKVQQLTLDKASRKRKRQEPENTGD